MEKLETNASAIEVRLDMVCNFIPVAFWWPITGAPHALMDRVKYGKKAVRYAEKLDTARATQTCIANVKEIFVKFLLIRKMWTQMSRVCIFHKSVTVL